MQRLPRGIFGICAHTSPSPVPVSKQWSALLERQRRGAVTRVRRGTQGQTALSRELGPPRSEYNASRTTSLEDASTEDETPVNRAPHKTTPGDVRHLLRALLRQSTYLPDSNSRVHIRKHIIGRFRDYTPSGRDVTGSVKFSPERLCVVLKDARKKLSFLKEANRGKQKQLLKVLLLTYGRTGKRRHELIKVLLKPGGGDGTGITAESEALREQTTGKASAGTRGSKILNNENANPGGNTTLTVSETEPEKQREAKPLILGPKLKALLVSQAKIAPPGTTRPNPRPHSLALKIPETNAWGRTMPASRVKNMKKKWYARMLGRVLPPLPPHEWDNLQSLALGNTKFTGRVPRRPGIVNESEVPRTLRNHAAITAATGEGDGPHNLTPRYMRRMWARVFMQCPRMSYDAEWKNWKVEWGSVPGFQPDDSTWDVDEDERKSLLKLFEGVDAKGKLMSSDRRVSLRRKGAEDSARLRSETAEEATSLVSMSLHSARSEGLKISGSDRSVTK
ncbi:hypothetical protein BJ546DRAFT_996473 [Cryomyces antarcticus]